MKRPLAHLPMASSTPFSRTNNVRYPAGFIHLLCPVLLATHAARFDRVDDTPMARLAFTNASIATAQYPLGKPFGPIGAFRGYTIQPGPWTETLQSTSPGGLRQQLDAARARKMRLLIAMTGGSHGRYITDGKFDLAKWKAAQSRFDTPPLRAAVAAAVSDGTLIGASLIDEPNHTSWGGVVTPATLDEMSRYVKSIFPSLPTTAAVQWSWNTDTPYTSLDFIVSQYSTRLGPVSPYISSAVATAKHLGIGLMFSMNVLNGGTQDRNGTWDCAGTGGLGTGAPNCAMTAQQLQEFGAALLGSSACGLLMWQYSDAYMSRPDVVAAVAQLADYAARQPASPCQRP